MRRFIVNAAATKAAPMSQLEEIGLDYRAFKKLHPGQWEQVPQEIKNKAQEAVRGGAITVRQIAKVAGVDPSSVRSWIKSKPVVRNKKGKKSQIAEPTKAPDRPLLDQLVYELEEFKQLHPESHARFPTEIKDKAREIVKGGTAVSEIANATGLCYGTIRSWTTNISASPSNQNSLPARKQLEPPVKPLASAAANAQPPMNTTESLLAQLAHDYKAFKRSHPELDAPIPFAIKEKARSSLEVGATVSQIARVTGLTPGKVSGWMDLIAAPREKRQASAELLVSSACSDQTSFHSVPRQYSDGPQPNANTDWITVRVQGREFEVRGADFWNLMAKK